MKHIKNTFITLLCITFLSITSLAQNTSPVYVVEFNKIQNGIMDEGKLQKNQLEDYDNNPVCLVKVKAQGFDEATLQKIVFVPHNVMIMHKAYENGEYRLYVSSKKPGSILMKYQGECEFKLPYNLEPKKIYELVLGLETATLVIKTSPSDAAIYIDDERAGTGYASKAVSIGAEHRYKVESKYYYPKEDVVLFDENEKKELVVNLEPAFGFVTVKTTPSGADVYVDDKLAGRTPYLSEIIGLGMHKITVNKDGYETDVKRVNINLNEEQTIEFELVEGESSMPVQQGSGLAVVAADKEHDDAGDKLPEKTETQKVYTKEDIEDNNIIIGEITKEGDKYVIEYSLDERASAIGLFYSEDNGTTWKQAKYIEGDFYNVWPSEKRQIAWDFSKETDLGTTPAFKLKIMQKESIDKAYRKNLEKRGFAEKNSTAYYYDNGKLLRKFYGGWFVQPEIGMGYCNYYQYNFYDSPHCDKRDGGIITVNCLFGYQIVRPFGIGLKIGYMRDLDNFDGEGGNSMPVTLNMKGFLGKGRNSIYYNIGFGYLANLKGYTEVKDEQSHNYYNNSLISCCISYRNIIFETERSGLLLSAEIGLAIRNFNIGIEYNFTKIHYSVRYDCYKQEGNGEEVFVRHVSDSEKEIDHVFLLKLGYNIPLKKK